MAWRVLTAGLVAALIAAAPARADTYAVTGPADSSDPGPCQPVTTGAWTCDTLRAAVFAANADPNADFIGVGPASIQLVAGDLEITENVTIAGSGAEVTSVGGIDLSERVFTITNTSVVDISGLTVTGGFSSGLGGNILVEIGSDLSVRLARVTRGNAISGGGIAVRGRLTVDTSLIDGNSAQASGGAIANRAEDNTVNTTVTNSTLAKNYAAAGAGLYSVGLATTTLIHTTIGRNTGEGVYLQNAQSATATGVIVAGNTLAACAGNPFTSATGSITDGTTCGFPLQALDPQLSADLVPFPAATLPTSVLTIPATSPAVDIVNPCQYVVDQRFAPRYAGVLAACDAGAYEESAGGAQPPAPAPTPTPTPVVTPTPTATPTPPVFNRSVGVEPVSGTVQVCPPRERCRALRAGETIPMGSTVDARKGRVRLTSLPSAGGTPQTAEFYEGIFRVTQVGSITQLTLTEKLAPCSRRASAAQSKKPKSRRLWGDGKGKFRTRGQYAAATIRGTRWLTQDSCAGTLVRVTQGSVSVRDFRARKTVTVRKGKRYLARARR